jgi:hypothetical protein
MARPKKTTQGGTQSVEKPDKSHCRPKNTSITKILHQKAANPKLTNRQLAKINNVSQQAISQMFQRYGINENYLESFKEHRADILAGIQETVLGTLTVEDIKGASFRDRTVAMGILYDKERLERGQSTSNVATILATNVIEAGKQWTKAPATEAEIVAPD